MNLARIRQDLGKAAVYLLCAYLHQLGIKAYNIGIVSRVIRHRSRLTVAEKSVCL